MSPSRSSRITKAQRAKSSQKRRKSAMEPPPLHRSLRSFTSAHKTKADGPRLQDLPDEPLTQIMSHLLPMTPSLRRPPGFSLALTNTRFYAIFRSLLTEITPYISNPTLPTLSKGHLAVVSRIAGERLKVIHLPEGALFAELVERCPNVEELCFRDDWASHDIVYQLVNGLPQLRSVEVHRPSEETLSCLHVPLEKIVLKEVGIYTRTTLSFLHIRTLKQLVLELEPHESSFMETVIHSLKIAIKRIEKVSVTIPSRDPPETFAEDVNMMIASLREERRESVCKEVFLRGEQTFRLLQSVDSKAKVTLAQRGAEFCSDGPGEPIYLVKLPLLDQFLDLDLTKVDQISIYRPPSPVWRTRLPKVHHTDIQIENLFPLAETKIASIPIPRQIHCPEWRLPTKELHFEGRHLSKDNVLTFCDVIVKILTRFEGDVLWMDFVRGYDMPNNTDEIRRYVRRAMYSCEHFEQKGGDASSILTWLDDVYAKCF